MTVALAGVILSIVLVSVFSGPGMRLGLLDYSCGRKQHGHPAPVVGGVAIVVSGFIAFGAAVL